MWKEDTQSAFYILGKIYDPDLTVVIDDFVIASSSSSASDPSIGAMTGGGFAVAWESWGGSAN